MHDKELELIAALAEGRLEDETEARALVASHPKYREEYEAQKLAFDTLSGVGSATLSETERAGLRRDLWTELRATPAAKPARNPWFVRWAPVAAGLVVVIGLAVSFDWVGGGAFDTAPIAAESGVTTTAADTSGVIEDGADTAADDGADAPSLDSFDEEQTEGGSEGADGAGDDGGGESDGAETETTTVATVDRSLTPSGEQFYAETAEEVRSEETSEAAVQELQEGVTLEGLQECVNESGLEGYRVLGALPSPEAGNEDDPLSEDVMPFIAAIPEGADLSSTPIAFIDLFDCDLLYLDE